MIAITLALLASLTWGSADFLGGISSRMIHPLRVMVWAQLCGLTATLMVLAVLLERPTTSWVINGVVAGICGAVGIAAFYEALRTAPMSLVAPITASSVAVPVIVSFAMGEVPTGVSIAGMIVVLIGIVAISLDRTATSSIDSLSRRALGLSLVAALGFGGALTLLAHAGGGGSVGQAMWATVGMRIGSIAFVWTFARARSTPLAPPPRRAMRAIVGVGLFEVVANTCYAVGTSIGNLAVVAVLSSLYPAVVVLLAMVFLHERMVRHQWAGVVAAMAGVAMIAAGSAG